MTTPTAPGPDLTGRLRGLWASESGRSIVAQILSSARNFAFLILVAGALDASDFGYVAILVTIVIGLNEFLRAIASHPLALHYADTPQDDAEPLGGSVLTSIGFAVLLGAVGATLAALTSPGPQGALAIGLACYPVIAAHDALRVGALNLGRATHAVIIDGLWLVFVVPALLIALSMRPSALVAVGVWAATAALATAITAISIALPLSIELARRFRQATRSLGTQMAVQVAFETVPTRAVPLLIAAMLDASVAGAIRGAEVMLGPTTVIYSGLALTSLRQARQRMVSDGFDAAERLVGRAFALALACLAGNVGLVLLLPDSIGSALLGETWTGARSLTLPVAAVLAALILLAHATVSLRAALRVDLANRIVAGVAIVSVVAAALGTHLAGARWGLGANAAAILLGVIAGAFVRARVRRDVGTPLD